MPPGITAMRWVWSCAWSSRRSSFACSTMIAAGNYRRWDAWSISSRRRVRSPIRRTPGIRAGFTVDSMPLVRSWLVVGRQLTGRARQRHHRVVAAVAPPAGRGLLADGIPDEGLWLRPCTTATHPNGTYRDHVVVMSLDLDLTVAALAGIRLRAANATANSADGDPAGFLPVRGGDRRWSGRLRPRGCSARRRSGHHVCRRGYRDC